MEGRFEIMLHGYHHDEPSGNFEFAACKRLAERVSQGRKYLEDMLGGRIRVFFPPRNAIGREGFVLCQGGTAPRGSGGDT